MVTCFFGTQCSAAGTRRRLLNSTVVTMDHETVQMKQLPDNEFNNTQTTESTQTDRQTDQPCSLVFFGIRRSGGSRQLRWWCRQQLSHLTSRCWLWLFLHVSHLSHNDTKCHTVTSRCWLWLFLHVSHLSHNVTQCNWVSHSDEQMLIVTLLTYVTPVTQWH